MISSGEFIRKWHEENKIPLDAPDKIPKDIDHQLDYGLQKRMIEDVGVVFESHLGGWLAKDLPESFKILCTARWEEMMKRAAKRDGHQIEDAESYAKKRAETLYAKFKRLYGVEDTFDPSYFDLVVDTTTMTKEEVLHQVLDKLEQ
jgi:cytidylate kinase